MDLGIDGHAAVAASSSGLGKDAANALVEQGANVVVDGRGPDRLETAAELRATAQGTVEEAIDGLVLPNAALLVDGGDSRGSR